MRFWPGPLKPLPKEASISEHPASNGFDKVYIERAESFRSRLRRSRHAHLCISSRKLCRRWAAGSMKRSRLSTRGCWTARRECDIPRSRSTDHRCPSAASAATYHFEEMIANKTLSRGCCAFSPVCAGQGDDSHFRWKGSGRPPVEPSRASSEEERIITIEDTAELSAQSAPRREVRTRRNLNKEGGISQRHLVRTALPCVRIGSSWASVEALKRWTCCKP